MTPKSRKSRRSRLPARDLGRQVLNGLQAFLHVEASGGIMLLGAAIIALIWANVSGSTYHRVFEYELLIQIGPFEVEESLEHWVNDALMVFFFFVIGLEIKREMVIGELRDPRAIALPVIAALGGILLPAAIYYSLNSGTEASHGWGIPVATDIAFAVGVLALLGRRIPSGLRLFLLTLAIADDIGAIAIIAVFYTQDLAFQWLGIALATVLFVLVLQRMGVAAIPVYVVVGIILWYAVFRSGVHATIGGVVLGLLTPARSFQGRHVLQPIENALHPWSSFLVLPIFALANTGIELSPSTLSDALASRPALGIMLGLLVGKTVGISLASFAVCRLRIGRLPRGVTARHILGAAALGGIGFTVSLFIAVLSFDQPELQQQAKIGVFTGSLVSALIGTLLLRTARLPVSQESPAAVVDSRMSEARSSSAPGEPV